jgi:mannonate dehydratase
MPQIESCQEKIMDIKRTFPDHDRRSMLKALGIGTASGFLGVFGGIPSVKAAGMDRSNHIGSLPALKIRSVKAIGTAPQGANLVIVKVETTEPGLYGLGCATFTQRAEVVVAAINNYMPDFCVGKDVDNIEDMWQSFFVSS